MTDKHMILEDETADKAKANAKTPLVSLVPSMVTLIGLGFGLFSLKFAVDNQWERAVVCIVFAAFIDGFDGLIARKLNATSKFGAELDSLSDFFNFAVAPAFISYMWMTNAVKNAGWAVCVFFVICGAIRLARFNAAEFDPLPDTKKAPPFAGLFPKSGFPLKYFQSHFSGIPAPAGGLLCLMPMMIMFYQAEHVEDPFFLLRPSYYMVYVAVIGALMMSRVPTPSLKGLRIPQYLVPPVMAGFAGFMVSVVVNPWLALPAIGTVYLLGIPFTYMFGGYTRDDK